MPDGMLLHHRQSQKSTSTSFISAQERDRALDAARKSRAREVARDAAKSILRSIEGALRALGGTQDPSRRRPHLGVLKTATKEVKGLPSASRREFDRIDKSGLLFKALNTLEDDESSASNGGSNGSNGDSNTGSHTGGYGN